MTTLSRLPLIASFLIAAPAYAGSCPAPRAADLAVTIELSTSSGEAHGSGFIWDAAGRVVTNHHVATAGFEPRITYSDGRRVAARCAPELYDPNVLCTGSDRMDLRRRSRACLAR